jgi:hypothetical protein
MPSQPNTPLRLLSFVMGVGLCALAVRCAEPATQRPPQVPSDRLGKEQLGDAGVEPEQAPPIFAPPPNYGNRVVKRRETPIGKPDVADVGPPNDSPKDLE